jgi:hypothetical protein
MIEQTELIVTKWQYRPPVGHSQLSSDQLTSDISLDVMKKRAANKKGIACRFTCEFVFEKELLLEYMAENSYVIDLADVIDRAELQTMIRNTYSQFKEMFDIRKLGTIIQDKTLLPFDDSKYDLGPVLMLLE